MTRAFDNLVSIWTFCEDEDRDAFIAYLRICGYAITRQIRGNGPDLPDETATEKQAACMSRSEEFEKPAGPSRPVTAAGADTLLPSVPATHSIATGYAEGRMDGMGWAAEIVRNRAPASQDMTSTMICDALDDAAEAILSEAKSDAPLGVSTGPDGRLADKSPVAHFPAHGLNPDGVA